ncbi:MAG: efflux RND transporter permease subunit [Oceanococcus sp.]
MLQSISNFYFRLTLQRRWLTGLILLSIAISSLWFAQDFRLDASADSLILENDEDLRYFRELSKRYGTAESVVVAYTPTDNLFSDAVLQRIAALRDDLAAVDSVASVTSLLDVPLLNSPRMTLSQVQDETRTLLHPKTDRDLAQQEFSTSPLYKSLLTDPAGETTALLVTLRSNADAQGLLTRREALREQAEQRDLNATELAELTQVSSDYQAISSAQQQRQQQTIRDIRSVIDKHRTDAQIVLGGLPMIASDMIDFVRADIRLFSLLVGGFLVLLLAVAFRQLRWVLIPAGICASVSISMVGLLGLMNWPVTVVSSNFTSLTLIITLSLVVHLVVRYRELQGEQPQADGNSLVRQTIRSKFAPSVFTAATTMVSFGSLIIADIRPVIDFGQMMVCSVVAAFALTFLLFPWVLGLIRPSGGGAGEQDVTARITRSFAATIRSAGGPVLLIYALLLGLAIVGISRLGVENRFIDYFKDSTEIYKGMVLIDKKLGGTTPLDVILDPPSDFLEQSNEADSASTTEDAFADDFLDDFSTETESDADFAADFEDEFAQAESTTGISGDSYWYNVFALQDAKRIHDYLDGLDETGKVLSMATTMDLITLLNNDEAPDNFTLAVMYGRLPPAIKEQLFDPYMSEDGNQLRFAIRVIDSDKNLRRDALLKKIRTDLVEQFNLQPEQVHLAGALVLYNNVLQSLFESQILTLSAVFVAIVLMLWGLFGSLRLALIGVLPTVFAASMILGLMGWLDIPLDIMTITIAAITIGIGVDNTIHYTHRFQDEINSGRERWDAMEHTHGSVGRAIYLTSVIVTLGFSILALSNFVPIVLFGLFTGLAMLLALIANLSLLPLLLVKLGPKA